MELPVCFYKNGGDSSYALTGSLQASGMPAVLTASVGALCIA